MFVRKECSKCDGTGKVRMVTAPQFFDTCLDCQGSGFPEVEYLYPGKIIYLDEHESVVFIPPDLPFGGGEYDTDEFSDHGSVPEFQHIRLLEWSHLSS